MGNLVAVYGTLREGFHNNYLLDGAKKLGKAMMQEMGTMYSSGGFPILSLTEKKTNITAEVYEVDNHVLINYLDRLEGYPNWYNRSKMLFQLDDGNYVEAWIYHQDGQHNLPIVTSGDWANK